MCAAFLDLYERVDMSVCVDVQPYAEVELFESQTDPSLAQVPTVRHAQKRPESQSLCMRLGACRKGDEHNVCLGVRSRERGKKSSWDEIGG